MREANSLARKREATKRGKALCCRCYVKNTGREHTGCVTSAPVQEEISVSWCRTCSHSSLTLLQVAAAGRQGGEIGALACKEWRTQEHHGPAADVRDGLLLTSSQPDLHHLNSHTTAQHQMRPIGAFCALSSNSQ